MTAFRRFTTVSRRHVAARAGLVAFGVALALGIGLGLALGSGAPRQVNRSADRSIAKSLAVANDLDLGLEGRRKALRTLSLMPAIMKRQGEESAAFDAFRKVNEEFVSVGIESETAYAAHMESRTTKPGPRPRRISYPLGGVVGKGHLYGLLSSNWPEEILPDKGRFGQNLSGVSTVLIDVASWRTKGTIKPPAWKDLASIPNGRFDILRWADGNLYRTSIQRLDRPSPRTPPYAVVSGVPLSLITAQVDRARRGAIAFGVFLGLVAGTVAWVGIARSTRRLRAMNDVLEIRVAERTSELQAAERSFRGIFEHVPLGLYQCDPGGRFLRANPTLAATLGFADANALIDGLGSLQTVGSLEARAIFLQRLRTEGEVRGTTTLAVRADGRPVWLAESARAVRDKDGEIVLIEGAMHDVTAQREVEDQLRRIGSTDPLTGLLNRRGLEEAIAAAEFPMSFVALDLDEFKSFNDRFGHPAGDRALQAVAEAIRRTVRGGDAAARAGGEEFVVILSRTDAQGARHVAENLRDAVARCDVVEKRITVSGGVATAESLDTVSEAIAAADRALYMAKEAGRNRIVVNPAKMA